MKSQVIASMKDMSRPLIKALRDSNVLTLRKLSNQSLNIATMYQDEDAMSFAVIIYSLCKIIERNKEHNGDLDQFISKVVSLIRSMRGALEKNNFTQYTLHFKKILSAIDSIDDKLSVYIQEVMEKSRISKGSSIYGHGISLARSAELLGISQWALVDYIGKTKIADETNKEGVSIKERIAYAKSLFNI